MKKPRPRSIYNTDIYSLNERGSQVKLKTEQFIRKLFEDEKVIHPREFREVAELISGIATIKSAMGIIEWRRKYCGGD
jgi:hypothetical protein